MEKAETSVQQPEDAGQQEDLAAQVARLTQENSETRERLLRVAADFENYKKRNERERQEYMRFVHERVLKDFLPVYDNLSRALEVGRKGGGDPAMVAGIEMVLSEFLKVLKKYGVEPTEAVGRPFDPEFHDALQRLESEDAEPGTVLAEIQRGFTMNGRVLRPALVVVATAPEVTSPGMRRDFD